ncbi:MAG: DcaP family trimeric outer membrane transporter, partial [Pirellulales bacterium]|nr:DcaP family trimeric outer membrane transporter [Pirellulales bacterium]
ELAAGFDSSDAVNTGVGLDFYGTPDFLSGLLIEGENALMKVGGYVKADLIHDLDPIDSQDVFDTTTIPVDAAPRENSRFHARQSRLNFDARWFTDRGMARVFIEGDFFGGSALEEETSRDRFRLRHAYGEIGSWIFGQTWSTFADVGAAPFTLDFEGAVSSISRRQAQVRYTTQIGEHEDALLSLAIEDPRVIVEVPDTLEGAPRTESPDFVIRVKNKYGNVRLSAAAVFREIGFQQKGEPVMNGEAWGLNFGGDARLGENDRIYSQIVWGEGIGSYKGLPDVVGDAVGSAEALTVFGWMVGWTHNWRENLSSNFTYSANRISPSMFQSADDLRQVTYLAVNFIAQPVERVFVGAEYLYGTRQNVDGQRGNANRFQFSFGFFLP